jgi:methyl coenzyme M reductase beta subunit
LQLPVNLAEGALKTKNGTHGVDDGVSPYIVVYTDLLSEKAGSSKRDADEAEADAVGCRLFTHKLF